MDGTPNHPATKNIMRWFEGDDLPEPAQTISLYSKGLAEAMVRELPEGPELTAGLRRLLEARDCFVRASQDRPGNHRSGVRF